MAPADRHRLAAKRGVVALFDAGVERIHVDMDDLALAGRNGRGRFGHGDDSSVLHGGLVSS
jgi:hypothetical protein